MITKKTYIKAAKIVYDKRVIAEQAIGRGYRDSQEIICSELENAFVELFRGDNPKFNKEKFLAACSSDK